MIGVEEKIVLIHKISKSCDVHVTFYGEPTKDAINKLIALLELQKDTFPTVVTEGLQR